MSLDDFDPDSDELIEARLRGFVEAMAPVMAPVYHRCEICLRLGIGNGALADLGDCPICKRYTRLNTTGTCGREYCSRLWKRAKREARRD